LGTTGIAFNVKGRARELLDPTQIRQLDIGVQTEKIFF